MSKNIEIDEMVYRSPVTRRVDPQKVSKDAEQFSTLKNVQGILSEAMDSLGKDFNAFELVDRNGSRKNPEDIVKDIQARQVAHDILAPIKDAVDSAIASANIN